MTTLTTSPRLCDHCGHPITEPAAANDELGFGYSRDPDTTPTDTTPVPDGVALFFFTGRTPRRAAA